MGKLRSVETPSARQAGQPTTRDLGVAVEFKQLRLGSELLRTIVATPLWRSDLDRVQRCAADALFRAATRTASIPHHRTQGAVQAC